MKNDIHLETSSAFDIPIIRKLEENGSINKDVFVLCNGYKKSIYTQYIMEMIEDGFKNVIPILDNMNELQAYAPVYSKKN